VINPAFNRSIWTWIGGPADGILIVPFALESVQFKFAKFMTSANACPKNQAKRTGRDNLRLSIFCAVHREQKILSVFIGGQNQWCEKKTRDENLEDRNRSSEVSWGPFLPHEGASRQSDRAENPHPTAIGTLILEY